MDNVKSEYELYRFLHHDHGHFVFSDMTGKVWIFRSDVTCYTIGPVGHPGLIQRYDTKESALIGILSLVGKFCKLGE
jgi:hypothetical protein